MSRAWLGVLVSFALFSLMAGSAVGQSQEPFFRIDAKDALPKTITKDLGSEQLHFNVSVVPTQQGALADRFVIRLDVTMDAGAVPSGFTAVLSAPDSPSNACSQDGRRCTVDTAHSKVVKFLVTITNTVTDPDQPSATVTLDYQSTPRFQGAEPDPLTAALISGMQQTDSEDAKGTVGLKLDASEKLASFVKRYPWPILAVAGGIFVLGVVLVRKRKGGLRVSSESPVQEVLPGRGASFPIQVTNEGGQKQSLSLTTSDVPPGWSSILPVERIELGPNETTTIWLTLKAPQQAHPGEHTQVNFVATSQDGATAESLVEAVVVERYGAGRAIIAGASEPGRGPASQPMHEASPVAQVAPKRRKA